MSTTQIASGADVEKSTAHAYLSSVLQGHWSRIVDVQFKHAGFLTLLVAAAGWALTEEKARSFFSANQEVAWLAAFGAASYFALNAFWMIGYYQESKKVFNHLVDDVKFLPAGFYEAHRIKSRTLTSFLIIDVIAVLVLSYVLYRIIS